MPAGQDGEVGAVGPRHVEAERVRDLAAARVRRVVDLRLARVALAIVRVIPVLLAVLSLRYGHHGERGVLGQLSVVVGREAGADRALGLRVEDQPHVLAIQPSTRVIPVLLVVQ